MCIVDTEKNMNVSGSSSSSNDNNNGGGGGDHNNSSSSSSSSWDVPLVELQLENVTYSPITTTATTTTSPSWGKSTASHSNSTEKKRKTVLSNITTKIAPYKLTAWMGPSGSGKTSLISVAADLTKYGDIQNGSMLTVNGEEGRLPKRLVGVVWQDDLLLSNLTVEETIHFAARLKTPKDVVDDEVQRTVEEVMEKLGLLHIRHNLVGSPTASVRGISGGERKRVAVAAELVVRPSLLLLDEPTSGLDATTAQALIQTLKDLAAHGHSIAVVIHQPRTSIYNMFDHLLLLSKGRMLYDGEASGARAFLESCATVKSLPPETGLADWMMDTIMEDERELERKGYSILAQHWVKHHKDMICIEETNNQEESEEKMNEINSRREKLERQRQLSSLKDLHAVPKYNASFLTQLKLLTQRTMKQQRGERLTSTAMLTQLAYVFFEALFWWRMPDTTATTYERNSLLFFIFIAQGNGINVSAVSVFQRERALMRRERAKKLYGMGSFFLSKTFSDMTNNVLLPLVHGMVVYWTGNLNPTWDAYFKYILALYLSFSTCQSTGLFLSILIPNITMALVLAPPITLFFMIMGGFYIPFENMHSGVKWASWLSFARYGYTALLIAEYEGRSIPCAEDDEVSVTIGDSDTCPLPGEDVLTSMGIEGVAANYWFNIGMITILQIIFRAASYLLLRRSK